MLVIPNAKVTQLEKMGLNLDSHPTQLFGAWGKSMPKNAEPMRKIGEFVEARGAFTVEMMLNSIFYHDICLI